MSYILKQNQPPSVHAINNYAIVCYALYWHWYSTANL